MRTFPLSLGVIALHTLLLTFVLGEVQGNNKLGLGIKSPKLVASTWYAGWRNDVFPLKSVPWKKYTLASFAFAETTANGSLDLSASNPSVLPEFVSMAKANGVVPSISIGGWTGSRFFSTSVRTAQNRTKFVKTVVDFAKQYKLGAVDFDWEYPAGEGIGCNTVSSYDPSNFLKFLQELRKDPFGKSLILTAAVAISPFTEDVSGFSNVLDYIIIMNYDIWGTWSATVGPNAPLRDSCAAPENQQGSAEFALDAWTSAGFPAGKLMLGVPAYGHSFSVTPKDALTSNGQLKPYAAYEGTKPGDAWDDPAGVDVCGNSAGPGGNYNFWGVIDAGLLKSDGSPKAGVPYRFDRCSQTAYVYDKRKQVMISFDDAPSFSAKGKFIKDKGLAGFSMWEAGGDKDSILLNSIRKSAGFRNV
ncbi:hypothetical protein ONZ45_g1244 [Pleurotus djamor]|nr:hypothetical protein ONZ45_g1244 [Pleurotus djamor]